VENSDNDILEDSDFASLLSSSEEFNLDWEDNSEKLESNKDDKLVLEDVVKNLKNSSQEKTEEERELKEESNLNASDEEILDILDKTDNSEQFFKKLEEIDYD
jgi:hypothetical protein